MRIKQSPPTDTLLTDAGPEIAQFVQDTARSIRELQSIVEKYNEAFAVIAPTLTTEQKRDLQEILR